MDEAQVLQKLTIAAIGALYAIGWWVWNRSVKRRDEFEARIMFLEKHSVSREELQQMIQEAKTDRRTMHDDNQQELKEMRGRMEEFEQRRSKTEHAILDSVHQIALKVAVIGRKGQPGE